MNKLTRFNKAIILALMALGIISIPVLAENTGEQPDLFTTSIKTLGALLLVLALIIVAAWAARKYLHFLPKSSAKGDHIQIIAVRALGPKRSIYLLEVEGHRILVGASDGGVSLLKEYPPARGTA
jgi:flagellar biosynthetic protein FliO